METALSGKIGSDSHEFEVQKKHPPQGHKWVNGNLTTDQQTSRPGPRCPELWTSNVFEGNDGSQATLGRRRTRQRCLTLTLEASSTFTGRRRSRRHTCETALKNMERPATSCNAMCCKTGSNTLAKKAESDPTQRTRSDPLRVRTTKKSFIASEEQLV